MNQKAIQLAIIFVGPPGAGKGTQAEYCADRLGLYHFETSKIIEQALKEHGDTETIQIGNTVYSYKDERENFSSGLLVTSEIVTFWVEQAIQELFQRGYSIVFCGSPRTAFEAEHILPLITKLFDPGNCTLFEFLLPPSVSVARNKNRLICAVCRLPHKRGESRICKKCGGELTARAKLDEEKTILVRIEEFTVRTMPVVDIAKRFGIRIVRIDAQKSEEQVFEDIKKAIDSR